MKNPLRSEADAFRLVFLAIGYFALIVLASWINTWLGVAVFVVLTLVAVWLLRGGRQEAPVRQHVAHPEDGEGERRILVVANETVAGEALRELVERRAAGVREDVLVVCPALNSPLRHWVSDEDGARVAAQARLDDCLARLAEAGVAARGEIGDGDPLQAIEDALRTFPADEIVVSTHPEGRSNWLERGVVAGARERFDVPVWHVIVDLEREAQAAPR
ncbi:MAG TPA: universal stress protein [Gaiellaceae bacterium]|nr:universal stress protein [Gaiellaceae bacterium]